MSADANKQMAQAFLSLGVGGSGVPFSSIVTERIPSVEQI